MKNIQLDSNNKESIQLVMSYFPTIQVKKKSKLSQCGRVGQVLL